jgi:hypothetical protein
LYVSPTILVLEFLFKDILFFLSSLMHILCPDLHLDNFGFLNSFWLPICAGIL